MAKRFAIFYQALGRVRKGCRDRKPMHARHRVPRTSVPGKGGFVVEVHGIKGHLSDGRVTETI